MGVQLAAAVSGRCDPVPGGLPTHVVLPGRRAAHAGLQPAAHLLHGARLQRLDAPPQGALDCCGLRAPAGSFAGRLSQTQRLALQIVEFPIPERLHHLAPEAGDTSVQSRWTGRVHMHIYLEGGFLEILMLAC